MKITQKYSHLNGEEYLIVHHNELYIEIQETIKKVEAGQFKTKKSKEKKSKEFQIYSPSKLKNSFKKFLLAEGWTETCYQYYLTLNRALMEKSMFMTSKEQKGLLISHGEDPQIYSCKQIDFVKNKIAVEVQFNKYSLVSYDIFIKQMLFYSGGVINLGIEILPTKNMQSQMSSGIAYFEGEVYNVMRHGRNNPPVPLLILGVEP